MVVACYLVVALATKIKERSETMLKIEKRVVINRSSPEELEAFEEWFRLTESPKASSLKPVFETLLEVKPTGRMEHEDHVIFSFAGETFGGETEARARERAEKHRKKVNAWLRIRESIQNLWDWISIEFDATGEEFSADVIAAVLEVEGTGAQQSPGRMHEETFTAELGERRRSRAEREERDDG